MSTKQKETPILKMDQWHALAWCERHRSALSNLWLKELQFGEDASKLLARNIEGMAGWRSSYTILHAQRAAIVVKEKGITLELGKLVYQLWLSLKGKATNPFPNELSQDEARAWLAETRSQLMAKIRHEKSYLKKCQDRTTQPHQHAATEEEILVEQEVLGLLYELLATFPPLKLPRPKRAKAVSTEAEEREIVYESN